MRISGTILFVTGGEKMGSVNFEKCKSARSVTALMRHCCKDKRLKTKHSNKHINKALTKYNFDYTNYDANYDDNYNILFEKCDSYEQAKNAYFKQIAYLDATTNTNHRPDRVTCFTLEMPAPAELDLQQASAWSHDVINLLIHRYGADNVASAHFHADEKHKYKVKGENGEIKDIESRYHLHAFVIPEVNGKLNGKQFSSRKNMIQLNKAIDDMTLEKYNCHFMDGTKRKSRKTVEELKNQSDILEIQQKQEQLDAEIAKVQQERNNMIDIVFDEINKELDNLKINDRQTLKDIVTPYIPRMKNRLKNNDSTLHSSTINDERLKQRRNSTDELINNILGNTQDEDDYYIK